MLILSITTYSCVLDSGNVLLTSTHSNPHGFMVKLADFGLSRRQGVAYPLKPTEGTCSYLAPEVLRGEPQSQVITRRILGKLPLK